jgi:hypothetical protein
MERPAVVAWRWRGLVRCLGNSEEVGEELKLWIFEFILGGLVATANSKY